jgi:peptide/nickel transport system permease protein
MPKKASDIKYTYHVTKNILVWISKRLVITILIIWIGITLLFIATRSSPRDPASEIIGRIMAYGGGLRGEELERMRRTILELYGLNKPIINQYIDFLKGVITWNFGPSFAFFPTPVVTIISRNILWTIFLMITAIIISWVLGIILGIFASYFEGKVSRVAVTIATALYPLPYVIFALILFMIFSIFIPIYRGVGGAGYVIPSISWEFIVAAFSRAWLPACSLIILWIASWFLSTYLLGISLKREDYIYYAHIRGLSRRNIVFGYIGKNVLLPQITALALSLGNMFSGALATEYIFSYPGLGYLILLALQRADHSLLIGVCTYSIVGIAVAGLILDIIYPLIDPRIKLGFTGE